MFLNKFQSIGRFLFQRGLVSSQSGNLSIRMGDHLIITRRGSNLGALEEKDLIETGINKNDRTTPLASIELPVHRAIYQQTQARAIVHAHPIHITALSFTEKVINLEHLENICVLGPVPILGRGMELKPGSIPDIIAESLKDSHIVALYGHGTFATGQLLEEAFDCTTALEEACEILCVLRSMQAQIPARG